jgi:hypothetical protein
VGNGRVPVREARRAITSYPQADLGASIAAVAVHQFKLTDY